MKYLTVTYFPETKFSRFPKHHEIKNSRKNIDANLTPCYEILFGLAFLLIGAFQLSLKRTLFKECAKQKDCEQFLCFCFCFCFVFFSKGSNQANYASARENYLPRGIATRFPPCFAFLRKKQFSRTLARSARFTIPKKNKGLFLVYCNRKQYGTKGNSVIGVFDLFC